HMGTVHLCNTYNVGIARFTGTGHSAKPAQYTKEPSPCVLKQGENEQRAFGASKLPVLRGFSRSVKQDSEVSLGRTEE
ncbi:MAG: hypothetical protein LBD95_00625, partial [Clostridiales Family XIII bacterium]|nr:hypothetical protein [Clostridiales Family XIII bacterium]